MSTSFNSLSQDPLPDLRSALAATTQNIDWQSGARGMMRERVRLYHTTYTSLPEFTKRSREGLKFIKQMQLDIDNDALDKILKMDLTGLPGLEALVKANIMQHFGGINHSQMLMIFEKACIQFEENDIDMALSIFMALLLLNPFIAALWFCVARCFETKKDLKQGIYNYAVCELLSKGNIYSAMDAVECLIAGGRKKLAGLLLREIQWEIENGSWSSEVKERATKLQEAVGFLNSDE
jgi:hypothetical protein